MHLLYTFFLHPILTLLIYAMVASAIISWLIVFDVLDRSNRIVWQITQFIDALTRPLIEPLRRIIPPIGSVDLSPLVLILILLFVRDGLLPMIFL